MGKKWKLTDSIFLGSKITVNSNCSHEMKRCLLLGKKAMTNLDSIVKSRDITLLTKVHILKAMVFPAVMYGCKSWTTKKAECQKIVAFKLWRWRRHLRVPWTTRRSNQSVLNPESSLESLVTWCEELMHWKRLRCWEILKAKEEGGDRGWAG